MYVNSIMSSVLYFTEVCLFIEYDVVCCSFMVDGLMGSEGFYVLSHLVVG